MGPNAIASTVITTAIASCPGGARRSQEKLGVARRGQEEPGGARRSPERRQFNVELT